MLIIISSSKQQQPGVSPHLGQDHERRLVLGQLGQGGGRRELGHVHRQQRLGQHNQGRDVLSVDDHVGLNQVGDLGGLCGWV